MTAKKTLQAHLTRFWQVPRCKYNLAHEFRRNKKPKEPKTRMMGKRAWRASSKNRSTIVLPRTLTTKMVPSHAAAAICVLERHHKSASVVPMNLATLTPSTLTLKERKRTCPTQTTTRARAQLPTAAQVPRVRLEAELDSHRGAGAILLMRTPR